jgi:hypothetical protein
VNEFTLLVVVIGAFTFVATIVLSLLGLLFFTVTIRRNEQFVDVGLEILDYHPRYVYNASDASDALVA